MAQGINLALMELSVVIPCLNAARTIGAQLEALSRQQWSGSWEVVVADNGSTDGTRAVVQSYRDRLPSLRIVDASDRRGAAHARNVGARAARGQAIVFCDADDEAGAGWLRAMGEALAGHDFVANRMDVEKLNPPEVVQGMSKVQGNGLANIAYPPYLPYAGGCGLGVRRALHEAIGGFDESLAQLEDTDYCFRMQLKGIELHFVRDALMHVRFSNRPGALFHQARLWARFNMLMYKRHRQGMRLSRPWRRHLSSWRDLIRNGPRALRKETRVGWVRTLGTQIGVLQGVLLYRVPPVR
jgi:glycosyltransferase involved in cell wall biosynthesis